MEGGGGGFSVLGIMLFALNCLNSTYKQSVLFIQIITNPNRIETQSKTSLLPNIKIEFKEQEILAV